MVILFLWLFAKIFNLPSSPWLIDAVDLHGASKVNSKSARRFFSHLEVLAAVRVCAGEAVGTFVSQNIQKVNPP